jgi:hypothetical protein
VGTGADRFAALPAGPTDDIGYRCLDHGGVGWFVLSAGSCHGTIPAVLGALQPADAAAAGSDRSGYCVGWGLSLRAPDAHSAAVSARDPNLNVRQCRDMIVSRSPSRSR